MPRGCSGNVSDPGSWYRRSSSVASTFFLAFSATFKSSAHIQTLTNSPTPRPHVTRPADQDPFSFFVAELSRPAVGVKHLVHASMTFQRPCSKASFRSSYTRVVRGKLRVFIQSGPVIGRWQLGLASHHFPATSSTQHSFHAEKKSAAVCRFRPTGQRCRAARA